VGNAYVERIRGGSFPDFVMVATSEFSRAVLVQ
jgi:hypothetical protein